MLQLNTLVPLTKKRKRVGRGGGRGGTSGRGMKGQKSRSGGKAEIKPFFEGGQMPLVRRIPRRGFVNQFSQEFVEINLCDLEAKFSAGATVDRAALVHARLLKGGTRKASVKILGNGNLTKALKVHAHAWSQRAADAIKQAGGEISLVKE